MHSFFLCFVFFVVASDSEQESSTFNKDSAIDIRPVTVLCHIFFLSLFFSPLSIGLSA